MGNVPRAKLDRFLDSLNSELSKLGPASEIPAISDEPALKAPRWVERKLGREQIHIIVGGLGSRITSKDRYPLALLQNILGGQSGRLFIELREKKSLAYSVAPIEFNGMEAGYIGTYIACSPSKREEAITGISAVLEQLARKGPSPSEMARAKQYYLGRRAMDLQSDSSIAQYLSLESIYGLPVLSDDELSREISRVTARQVQDACRKYLVEPHHVTAVVG